MVLVSDIIIKAGLHLREGWLILQDDELQEVDVFPKWKQLKSIVLGGYCQIWAKPPKMVDGMLKTTENGA